MSMRLVKNTSKNNSRKTIHYNLTNLPSSRWRHLTINSHINMFAITEHNGKTKL
jgi:hypothetical protein